MTDIMLRTSVNPRVRRSGGVSWLMVLAWALMGVLAVVEATELTSRFWLARPLARLVGQQLERPVSIQRAKLTLFTPTPGLWLWGVDVAGIQPQQPHVLQAGRLGVSVSLPALLRGQWVVAVLGAEDAAVNLQRTRGKESNWAAPNGTATAPNILKIPPVLHMYVRNGRLQVEDAVSGLTFSGHFATEEKAAEQGQPFNLTGEGTLNGQPFGLDFQGGGVRGLWHRQPYPFQLALRYGATHLRAQGSLQAQDGYNLDAALALSGKDLADVYDITGVPLPTTRPYHLKTRLTRQGDLYNLQDLDGRIGASDLHGSLSIDAAKARPLLQADLWSNLLNPADAGVVFGGRKALEGRTSYLFPDTTLPVTRFRAMDARVHYRAKALQVDVLPLQDVDLTLKLQDGTMDISPVTVTLPQGRLEGVMTIDTRTEPARIAMDIRLRGSHLEDFARSAGHPDVVQGTLSGRLNIEGRGSSFHQAAARASGTMALVVPQGEIRRAFAELAGVNLLRGLGLLVSGSKGNVAIRCGVMVFDVQNGLMRSRTGVVDTSVVRLNARGTLDLRDETMDLTVQGDPKHPRLLHLSAPLQVRGTLLHPSVDIAKGPLAVQAGTAAALGVALTPLASVLPFVDAGLAHNAQCGALLENAPVGSKEAAGG